MTQTLSQISPPRRLALLRRVPFWAQALALCALFAVAGVGVVDDYGVAEDEIAQRRIASANADYIATGSADGLYNRDYRYFGVAFEMPLLLAERALPLQDPRYIYLTRHLLTHLFFIAGGFACGALVYRTLGSRWVALLAMLMFLLHPRLYAHSFFNSKDVPFAAMLVIALYLTHRAFRKDTIGAFLLCGIVVGLAIDLRPFALMLLPMILAMRGLDLWQAGREERKRILLSGAAFLAAALATAYIVHPYYWENPLRLVESVREVSQHRHPTNAVDLFMGETYFAGAIPWNFIPVWFAITAPPLTLLLGAVGCAAVCWQGITRPIAALRDRETRFRILLLGCFVMPVVVVIALQSNIYNGWRHMYFLWAPFCLLAAVGLRGIANSNVGTGGWPIAARLPGWVRGGWRRTLAYGVVGVGLATTLTAMAALHPYEYVYFNALVDAGTPGALGEQYDMDYWLLAHRQSLEYLLARYPDDVLRVYPGSRSIRILPQNDRERVALTSPNEADFYINRSINRGNQPDEPAFHSVRAYGSAIAFIIDTRSDAYRDYYRAEYGDVERNGTLLARSDFDVYIHNGALHYLKESCEPLLATNFNDNFKAFLHIFPADVADLPADWRERGFENRDFWITEPIAFFDGKCIHKQPPLPDYPIARIRTGQNAAASGGSDWGVDIDMAVHAAARALYESITVGDYGQPVARADFDVYLAGDVLAYLKEPCATGDTDARFFLHIIPADPADLPEAWREHGFENLDFLFADHGAYVGDKCVVTRELPDSAIERIRTGQFVSGEGRVWGVEFAVGR